ncbi:MAG: hypothetical protein ACI4DO_03085 [Roseburia sp.]
MMKRKLGFILSIILTVTCAGCGKETAPDTEVVEIEKESEIETESVQTEEEIFEIEETEEEASEQEEQNLHDVYVAYADFLEKNLDDLVWSDGEVVYTLEYLDDDNIPELFFATTEAIHASNIYICKYVDGEVKCAGPVGAYNGVSFYEKNGVICTASSGMGVEGVYYSTLTSSGEIESLCREEEDYGYGDYDSEPQVISFWIGEEEVTEDEYNGYLNELLGDQESVRWDSYNNENGYAVLDETGIMELRNKE